MAFRECGVKVAARLPGVILFMLPFDFIRLLLSFKADLAEMKGRRTTYMDGRSCCSGLALPQATPRNSWLGKCCWTSSTTRLILPGCVSSHCPRHEKSRFYPHVICVEQWCCISVSNKSISDVVPHCISLSLTWFNSDDIQTIVFDDDGVLKPNFTKWQLIKIKRLMTETSNV